MAIPNLIHPIWVTVERLTRDEMVMDEDAREAVHGLRTTSSETIKIQAQIKWSQKDSADPEEGGVRERSMGYILCRVVDMDRVMGSGERLKRGDRIVTIGNLEMLDVYIVREEPMGHWQDQDGTTIIRYHFQDRHPVRQQGNL